MNESVDDLKISLLAPHFARYSRKAFGCPEGNLVCQVCGATNASRNRQRSSYHDSDNMATLCPACQKEADEYYDELWSEYYYSQGIL